MERRSPAAGLEEIFDEKLKAPCASLDYKELNNPVEYYQNSVLAKQEHLRACSRERASPSLFLPRGRQSPSVLSSLNINNPHFINSTHRRIKPAADPLTNSCEFSADGCLNLVHANADLPHNAIHAVNISGSFTRPSTPCESSISPKRYGSPLLRSKVLANRDKESLMDEIIGLKKALLDQSATLQRQKVLSSNLELENRKLEKEIEELMCQGNYKTVARPGPVAYDTRLRSKVQGLKRRLSQLEATCEMQQEELALLRRDMRVTRTRELEAERDVFAEEIERLQNFVKKLEVLQNRLFCENKQLWRYKDRNTQLEASTQRLENSSNDLQKSLEKANKEIHETTRRGNESFIRAKRAERQCQDLQEQASLLSKMVEKEKSEKLKLQQMIHVLQDEVQSLEASLSSKVTLQSSPNLGPNLLEEHQSGILAKTWGFLHGNAFHASKTRELDVEECEKMVLGERPKTRGERRTKVASGGDTETRKSRPKSPTKPTISKRALETTKLQPTSDLTQSRAREEGERRPSSASKNHRQEGEHVGEKLSDTKPFQPLPTTKDPRTLSSSKQKLDEPAREANHENTDEMQSNETRQRVPLAKEEENYQSKDTIAKLVDGMITLQESINIYEDQRVGNVQEHKYSSEVVTTSTTHESVSLIPKPAPNVLIPRLNLNQVGGLPHHIEETNSESSNAIHTSATNSNMLSPSTTIAVDPQCEQSHQKVIAWDDNIHETLLPPPHKLAMIEESRTPNDD